jgi:hypothetical protein
MNYSHSIALAAVLFSWGCGGQSASSAVAPAPHLVSALPSASSSPNTSSSIVANTGYITAPALVSAGMASVLAFVPTQPGATYQWSAQGATLSGVTQNAAVYFNAGAVGAATLQCVVTLSGVPTVYSQAIPVVAALPVTSFYYGSGLSADALANTVLGGPSLISASYRFQAKHASALKAIRVFFIWSLVKSGYQSGQGGTIQVDLKADDGSAAHLPTGPSLATVSYGNILSQNSNYPQLQFPYPAILTGGGLYHLVFTNVDPTPTTNYISLDSLYTDAQTAPMQPSLSDTTFAALVRSGTGAWKPRQGFTPILELDYADGGSQGNGYMEVWSTNPKPISGNAQVRETFKVSGPSRTFTRIMVRTQLVSGSSPLTLTLTEADGTLIERGTVPAASALQGAANWVTCSFPLSTVLSSGVAYNLTLSTAADTQYTIYPIRKGLDKGFSTSTAFPDGYAQATNTGATGWAGWDMWGTPNLTTSDLQFMFVP